MPSLQDLMDDKKKYADDMKVLIEGVETSLGELRSGFMKDSDYRQKTSKLAREREAFEADRTKFAQDKEEAEAQLARMVEQALTRNAPPAQQQAEYEALIERDPIAKRLVSQINKLEEKFTLQEKRAQEHEQRLHQQQQAMLADQHRRVLAALKTRDPELDEAELVQFAQQNAIPRLDMAYRLHTEEKRWKAESDRIKENAAKEAYEKAKRELAQPQLPQRRVAAPPPEDSPKTFDEAAERALRDPEILATMEGHFAP